MVMRKEVVVKVSVAMTTFNGEAYLEKQLESIRLQDRPPDEVVIRDDHSEDATIDIVNRYIRDHSLANWKLHVNPLNLGLTRNVLETIRLATGDVVFYADQDNVCRHDMIRVMTEAMARDTRILALAGRSRLIDDAGRPLPASWHIAETLSDDSGRVTPVAYSPKGLGAEVPGCTLAFTRRLVEVCAIIEENEIDGIMPDRFIWRVALLLDGACYIERVVLERRIHSATSSGFTDAENRMRTSMNIERRLGHLQREQNLARMLQRASDRQADLRNGDLKAIITADYARFAASRFSALKRSKLYLLPSPATYARYGSLRLFVDEASYILRINYLIRRLGAAAAPLLDYVATRRNPANL